MSLALNASTAVADLRASPLFRSSSATRSQLLLAQNKAVALKANPATPAELHPRINDMLSLIKSKLATARPI